MGKGKDWGKDGEGDRGKHRKKVTCSGCRGDKTVEETRDGKVVKRSCPLCGGKGYV
ncbi:DnaJ-class molecular chaperone [Actinomadura cellulosilytica]|uniref:DnaJ-class molecular chaperone n=1 Tax=Thermomonospora cellulosilytica TaxID=1411118 RepID=A0A7W3R6N3_9ACTN|nr:DnaJ-class molecular chaperone [Thermomonospora cellulosilytica]